MLCWYGADQFSPWYFFQLKPFSQNLLPPMALTKKSKKAKKSKAKRVAAKIAAKKAAAAKKVAAEAPYDPEDAWLTIPKFKLSVNDEYWGHEV